MGKNYPCSSVLLGFLRLFLQLLVGTMRLSVSLFDVKM